MDWLVFGGAPCSCLTGGSWGSTNNIIFPTFCWLLCWKHIVSDQYSEVYSTDSIWGKGLANRARIYDYWWFYFLFISLIVCCDSGLRALQMGAVRKMETWTTEASTPQWNYFRPIFLCISVIALLCICITAHFAFSILFGLYLFFCLFWLNWWLRHNLLDIKFLLFQLMPPPSCICICICICKWFWVLYIFCCFVFVFVSYFCLCSLQS